MHLRRADSLSKDLVVAMERQSPADNAPAGRGPGTTDHSQPFILPHPVTSALRLLRFLAYLDAINESSWVCLRNSRAALQGTYITQLNPSSLTLSLAPFRCRWRLNSVLPGRLARAINPCQ
jgi:hypothetical protein